MPLAQKLTKTKARKKLPIQGPDINRKGHNTSIAGGSGKAGTLITPKIDVTKITKDKEFQEQLYSLIDDIEITEDDIPDEMLEDWYDLQDELKPVLIEKNWLLWATLFSAVVLPGIVQGTRSEPTVKQPAVIIKGKQQEPIPPLEPRQIVNYSQEYFKEHGLELCKSLTETDLTRLKGDLVQNWNKGEDAFAKAFKESYPVSKQRLETIYRSERHLAEYHGVMKRAERAGHSYKQWRAVGDERTCDECMQYDMQIVPIGEPFSNGAMTASAHPGCRCSMISLTDDEFDEMPDEQFSDENLPNDGEEWDEETKQDATYLDEVATIMKQNYNCKDEEKTGSGKGSCGGESKEPKFDKNVPLASKPSKITENDWNTIGLINYGTMGGYGDQNSLRAYLKDPDSYSGPDKEEYKKQTEVADRFLNESRLNNNLTVYRGVVSKFFDDLKVGDTFSDPSFIHVTPDLNKAEFYANDRKEKLGGNKTILKLDLPKGTKAIDLHNLRVQDFPALILDRNLKMKVDDIKKVSRTEYDIFGKKTETSYNLITLHIDQPISKIKGPELKSSEFPGSPTKFKQVSKTVKSVFGDKKFSDFVEKFGPVDITYGKDPYTVKYGDTPRGAHFDASNNRIEIFESDKKIPDEVLKSKIRHEYGHKVYDTLSGDERKAFIDKLAPEILSEISPYAIARPDTEAFPELFSKYVAPDESYDAYMTKDVKQLATDTFAKMKQNSRDLNDAFDFIKLNYNCPDSEKSGTGKGSCGGNTKDDGEKWLGGESIQGNQGKTHEIINTPEYKNVLDNININNMDQKTQDTFRQFAENEYSDINESLYKEDNSNPQINKKISIMDNAFKNSVLRSNLIAYRGININKLSRDELKKWTEKGSKIPLPGYTSTSIDQSVAFHHGKLQVELEIPKGTKSIFMDNVNPELATGYHIGGGIIGEEFEILLHRGYDIEVLEPASPMFPDMNPDNPLFKWKAKARIIPSHKQNSLFDVADFLQKLNYNCPDSEKSGSGPGSCGGKSEPKPEEPRWKTSQYIMNSIDAQLDIHLPNKTAALIMQQGTKFNPNMREELNYKGSGIGLTKRIGGIPNVWYNKVAHEQYADNEGIYSEALHEIGHSLTYPYGDDFKKLDIWKDNSPKSLHEDLRKAGIGNMKGLVIDMSDEDEAFADLFKSYISPRTNLKLKAAAPEVYAKMETMFGKSDYDIDLPEPVMKLFKTLASKGWNLKSSDLKELGITEKQSEEIADLIEPPHAKGQSFIASPEWGNYHERMQKIKEMFVKPSDTLLLRRNSEKVMGETNKNLMTKGISSDEKKSLFSLKTNLYGDVGSYLTGGNSRFNDPTYIEKNQEYFNYIKDTVQKVDSVLDKSELSGDITTYRYVRSGYADILKQNIGKQILNKNYIYTTLTENIAKEAAAGKGAYLTMEVPKGIKGIDMDSFTTGDMLENEVMLERNLIMNIKEHKVLDNGMDWFKVSIEKPSQKHNQLSEVSDFIKLNYNCPDSEKSGEGPGSCGGKTETYSMPEPSKLKSEPGKVTLTWTAPDSPSKMTGSQFKIQFLNNSTTITVRYPKSDTKAAPRLARVLASVPPKLAVNVKKFILTDNPNKTDAIASKQYGKEFITAASFNKIDQSIAFFGRNGFTASISKDVLIHELTHALDAKLGTISRTKEYKQAVEMDSKLGKKSEFTSNYARDSYKVKYNDPLEEDMADGIPQYLKDGNKFSERFPNRAAFYKKMLGE